MPSLSDCLYDRHWIRPYPNSYDSDPTQSFPQPRFGSSLSGSLLQSESAVTCWGFSLEGDVTVWRSFPSAATCWSFSLERDVTVWRSFPSAATCWSFSLEGDVTVWRSFPSAVTCWGFFLNLRLKGDITVWKILCFRVIDDDFVRLSRSILLEYFPMGVCSLPGTGRATTGPMAAAAKVNITKSFIWTMSNKET